MNKTPHLLQTRIPRVLLIFPTSIMTCRWMLNGILRYVRQHGPWELHIIEGLWLQAGPFLRKLVEGTTFTPTEALDVDFHERIMDALEAKDPARAREAVAHDIREAAHYMLTHAKFMVG